MQNATHHDYRACHLFPLRYVCLRHAQKIKTVGSIKLKFASRTHNVFRIVPYKIDSKNVTGCREFQWKRDRQTDRQIDSHHL
jgi:hypothetical protein